MGSLFKLNTAGKGKRAKRSTPGDWHCKVKLGTYSQKRARLCTDAGTSETWAALLQAAVDRKIAGEPADPEAIKKLPRRLVESFGLVSQLSAKRRGKFDDNVDDYEAELTTAGRDRMYVGNVRRTLKAIGAACGWKQLADVNRDAFADYLAQRKADGTAPRTLNNEIATVKGFAAWCVQSKRLDENPFAAVKRVEQLGDRRRKRRALSRGECHRLLKVAGPRELVYRLALGTGLRRLELKRLQWRDVDVDDPARACLRLRAEATKSKRADVLPLTSDLATRLQKARPADVASTELVFRLGRTRTVVPKFQTWLDDLTRAGITYKGGDKSILGFHSLRVTYITELQKAGLPPRTVMELARHTDFRLTAGTYTDMRLIDTFGAVQKLPDYGPEAAAQVQLRTGTDDQPVGPKTQDQIQDQKTLIHKHGTAPACSVADFGPNRGSRGRKSKTSISHGKNRGFLHDDRAKEKAGVAGLETGLLGLEPRTF